MTTIISCNIKLEVGLIFPAVDKETNELGRFKVIREATEEEYLKVGYSNPRLLGNYYEVSFD